MASVSNIIGTLERCYLPKLSRNLEERESHPEFQEWELKLSEHFPSLTYLLNDLNSMEQGLQSSVISSVLILYFQLVSKGIWNTTKSDECAKKLDYQIELLYESTCSSLLINKKFKSTQEVFEKSMEYLHQKLSSDEFKKYPALIEAYCSIIKDIMYYDVDIKPISVMPISLLLIEDFVPENRMKGLKTCSTILGNLMPDHFVDGNYYEVIYRVLKKKLVEQDIEVSKLVLANLYELFQILPSQAKVSTIDDALGVILEQVHTETNLYRKKAYFTYINKIILIHGIHCAKRKMFLTVICDNLDVCCNDAVSEILLFDVLECLEFWTTYCWCVWKLEPNKKLMSTLIKLLLISCEKVEVEIKIQNNFINLCKLCPEEDRKVICNNFDKSFKDVKNLNHNFVDKLEIIRHSINY